jgi:hypothetical protein
MKNKSFIKFKRITLKLCCQSKGENNGKERFSNPDLQDRGNADIA